MKIFFIILISVLTFSTLSTAQCYEDRHNTGIDNAWVSCERSINPNASRGMSHWLLYDFGESYNLAETAYWNFNDPSKLSSNIREIVIDYSLDGENWSEWGTYVLDQATGSTLYLGTDGPDLSGVTAQYILITAIDNYGGDCYGLSEIKFNIGELVATDETPQELGELLTFPNPTSGLTNLHFSSHVNTEVYILVSDISGKMLRKSTLQVRKGAIEYALDLSEFQSGTYIISVKTDGQVISSEITLIK